MRFNILPSHLRFSKTGLIVVYILVVLLSFAVFNKAYADPQKETQKREAWMKAGEYAKENPVIGIAVYGHAKDATAEQIGKFIKTRFEQMGIPSIFFTGREDRLGASVGFYLKDMQYGPTGISGIQKNINTLATHFVQAWPNF